MTRKFGGELLGRFCLASPLPVHYAFVKMETDKSVNAYYKFVLTLGLMPILLGCQSQQALKHSTGTGNMTAKEMTAVRKDIQALNDRWGNFCISVVKTKDFSKIAAEMADKFTQDVVGEGFDGKREEGLERAVDGASRFLAGLIRLNRANIQVDRLEWQNDGTVQVVTTFDWGWEVFNSKTGRIHRIDNKGREKATYVRTPTGWKISRSNVLEEKYYTDGKLDKSKIPGQ